MIAKLLDGPACGLQIETTPGILLPRRFPVFQTPAGWVRVLHGWPGGVVYQIVVGPVTVDDEGNAIVTYRLAG
jgi:hypothetical protein